MATDKTNVFDYIAWRGEFSFEQSEFNEVDSLILSIFSYLDFSCVSDQEELPFPDAVAKICAMPDEKKYDGPSIIMHSVVKLAQDAAGSIRFRDMKVFNFVDITEEEREIQFAAVSFLLPDQTIFASFRGTDNKLVGWKEDLNMSFINGVPSQLEATKYVTELLGNTSLPVRLGGHSKGGNLAIWAGAHQESALKSRIIQIYSNDGPGFSEEFLHSALYRETRSIISSFVPESSIVGVLMEHDHYTTIMSKNATVLQHDPFSWLVLGSHFRYDENRTLSGMQFEKIINSWIRSMSAEEREQFITSFYDILIASEAKTIDDIDKNKLRSLFMMSKSFRDMGFKKQVQLLHSLSKVIFNRDLLDIGNPLRMLSNRLSDSDLFLFNDF